eukprot:2173660-Pleurochrysis_carterae.AAC.1
MHVEASRRVDAHSQTLSMRTVLAAHRGSTEVTKIEYKGRQLSRCRVGQRSESLARGARLH